MLAFPCTATVGVHVRRRGFTLIELLVSIALLGIVMTAVAQLMQSFEKMKYTQGLQDELKLQTQAVTRAIQTDVMKNKRVFGSDTIAGVRTNSTYMTRLKVPTTGADIPLVGTFLPKLRTESPLSPNDTAYDSTIVGNALCFAKNWDVHVVTTSGRTYRINSYGFVYYYLTKVMVPFSGSRSYNYTLALVRWESAHYASWQEIHKIGGGANPGDSLGVMTALRGAPHNLVNSWDASRIKPDSSFYPLTSMTAILSNHQPLPFHRGYVVEQSNYKLGVAFNYDANKFPIDIPVPRFAAATTTSDATVMFPQGFEIMVVGPTSARMIFYRLVLASWTNQPHPLYREASSIVTAVDY